MGHIAIFLIGDFTARIGDPTERSEARIRLTKEQVWEHAKIMRIRCLKSWMNRRLKSATMVNGLTLCLLRMSRSGLQINSRTNVGKKDFEKRFKEGSPLALRSSCIR